MDARLNATSVRRQTLQVARRCAAELGPEPRFPLAGCSSACASLPTPPAPISVGLDGGYLRHNQELVFLSDGEESLRQLQCYLRPHSQHLLDWFHLTMPLTGLGQSLKGLTRFDPVRAADLQEALEHTNWNLWHGKLKRAHAWLRRLEGRMWYFASRYATFSALARAVHGFQRSLWRNGHLIPNYARRRRAGQVISTAFVESLVNTLLSQRFAKKQSMQWTPEGAHLLLQTRTRPLNGDLVEAFRSWYPAFSLERQPIDSHSLAA